MTILEQAAHKALEALENAREYAEDHIYSLDDAIIKLRQALETKDEFNLEVLIRCVNAKYIWKPAGLNIVDECLVLETAQEFIPITLNNSDVVAVRIAEREVITAYTAPPKTDWVGFTEEERVDILDVDLVIGSIGSTLNQLCLTIESRLKEKNSGGAQNSCKY